MQYQQKRKSASTDIITEMVVATLRRIMRAVDLRSRYLEARYGLTGPQLVLLKELSSQGSLSVGELTDAVHLSQATVTGILDRLAKRGLVRRERSDEDKRRVLVWLTSAGKDLLAHAPPLVQEEFTEAFGKLQDWEQTQILSALQRVVSMMETKHAEAAFVSESGPVTAARNCEAADAPPASGSDVGAGRQRSGSAVENKTGQGRKEIPGYR